MYEPISIKINNETRPLRLTLGALADIEDAFGGDLDALKTRLANPRVGDMLVILAALLRGGGAAFTVDALRAADIDLSDAAAAIARAFEGLEAPGKPAALSAAATTNGAPGSSTP